MFATIDSTLFLILFMFLVIMFIVYFDYMLSIVRLSSCSCISSYSTRTKVLGVSGRYCVSVVLIHCLPVDCWQLLSTNIYRQHSTKKEGININTHIYM
jgi:uncharacterized membrane protein